ncbi:MAG: hypothetical protein J0M08_09250 [Bacteroidetes bacterium]|nr:hypothetical protein [Bacteroidota bacterium]
MNITNPAIYLSQQEIVDALILQLNKDFELTDNLFIVSNYATTYIELLSQIRHFIKTCNPEKLASILYRVDVSEQSFLKNFGLMVDGKEENEALARQIIFRELYKVLLRKDVLRANTNT